jgi:hypothetical protein
VEKLEKLVIKPAPAEKESDAEESDAEAEDDVCNI